VGQGDMLVVVESRVVTLKLQQAGRVRRTKARAAGAEAVGVRRVKDGNQITDGLSGKHNSRCIIGGKEDYTCSDCYNHRVRIKVASSLTS
jgi:hypothetical protein